ncbi:MAG TPA: dTDP-4-amino-4,6-dideoxyglucose formyltransferase [Allosphingosinicella sp.]
MTADPPLNVLIISDNGELARHFVEEFQRPEIRAIAVAELRYSSVNKNPSSLVALGAEPVDLSKAPQVTAIVRDFGLVISAHCKKIFPPALVNGVRCVNFHPGFNPHNRGWYPQVFSILNGKPLGVTAHEMNEEIDGGPIIARRQVALSRADTSLTAYARVIEAEKALIRETLPAVIRGDYTAFPPEAEGNYNGIADYRQLLQLDLGHRGSLHEHIDLLRALSHPPFWNAYFLDERGNKVFVQLELQERP